MASSPLVDRHGHDVHGPLHGTRHPAHQFETMEQQKESSTLGMWLFLVTEIMFFGGLFLAYVVYRTAYPAAFAASSATLNVPLGAANTVVLIGSSLTMALAIWAAQVNWRKGILIFLLLTMALGTTFLVVKGFEYHEKFVHHHVPGPDFQFDGPQPENAQIFFSLYFIMTGLHATHMIVGLGILIVLFYYAKRGKYDSEYYNPLEVMGLYWHFVDIIWIFLFPLLYLLGAHTAHGG